MPDTPTIDDTFAEAFPMRATRLIITAVDEELAEIAAREFCGNASSVIGCDTEAGIEGNVPADETLDGRPGIAVLAFAFDKKSLGEGGHGAGRPKRADLPHNGLLFAGCTAKQRKTASRSVRSFVFLATVTSFPRSWTTAGFGACR